MAPPSPPEGADSAQVADDPDTGTELTVRVVALAEHLPGVRARLSRWLRARQIPERVSDDIVLAADEALTNAIMHGYQDTEPGPVLLTAAAADDAVTIQVTDFGTWKTPEGDAGTTRGWGLPLIESLARELRLDRGAGRTTLTAEFGF
ncbi:ATP-binding protein [Actinokineospora sp. NBRC 105648]|uniref:ATP-binding protein n=1 Tax=Actinokineospora sp. NBRC 105648 TaxID=3032206 RepID=UPI0024A33EC8|nr:ATP-binding protein [Actinokineospora sp. NBRC 105648]GLZ42652.1 anti-sigma regulatory factor [Actinokineospora sp. NBRC 105648]